MTKTEVCQKRHTPCPEGYLQKHGWMLRMSKTHKQTRCPECGLWAIWVRKGRKRVRGRS
jgi:hypothetical protein